MSVDARYEPALRRILWTLRPYLDQMVIIGGWVPHLYRRYGGFSSWSAGLSLTAEVDVLVERPLPPGDRPLVSDILRESGFHTDADGAAGAVWLGDVAAGEKIEFLVPHTGTGRQQGALFPIDDQRGMRAISLPGLELMAHHKRRLRIPVTTMSGAQGLDVWVPWLGAYVVNKASTRLRRPHVGGTNDKRFKDLLYLRDLAAAGPEVFEHIAGDLRNMRHGQVSSELRSAANTLRLALSDGDGITQTALLLRERDRERQLSQAGAVADLRGHIGDLVSLLRSASA